MSAMIPALTALVSEAQHAMILRTSGSISAPLGPFDRLSTTVSTSRFGNTLVKPNGSTQVVGNYIGDRRPGTIGSRQSRSVENSPRRGTGFRSTTSLLLLCRLHTAHARHLRSALSGFEWRWAFLKRLKRRADLDKRFVRRWHCIPSQLSYYLKGSILWLCNVEGFQF